MYNYKINDKEYGPYEAIFYPNGNVEGDINPIIFDNAEIEINGDTVSYILAYKISKNLFGKEIKYADIICEQTGETFSFQVNNIFIAKVVSNDLKIIARIGDDLKFYEKFGKTEYLIEPDGDKKEITPLGYYDTYVRYDNDFYYPLFINDNENSGIIERFYDYYGFKSFIDDEGTGHLIMLLQDEKEDWYWVDNFVKFSEIIKFADDVEEIETWEISLDGVINFETNYNKKYHLDDNGKIVSGVLKSSASGFTYTRTFEDTDIDYIVGQNNLGFFIINRLLSELTDKQKNAIIYYKKFISYINKNKKGYFLMEKEGGEICLVDEKSQEIISTDISGDEEVSKIDFDGKMLIIELSNGETRKYL